MLALILEKSIDYSFMSNTTLWPGIDPQELQKRLIGAYTHLAEEWGEQG